MFLSLWSIVYVTKSNVSNSLAKWMAKDYFDVSYGPYASEFFIRVNVIYIKSRDSAGLRAGRSGF